MLNYIINTKYNNEYANENYKPTSNNIKTTLKRSELSIENNDSPAAAIAAAGESMWFFN